jgi:hypothetical protein
VDERVSHGVEFESANANESWTINLVDVPNRASALTPSRSSTLCLCPAGYFPAERIITCVYIRSFSALYLL